MLIFPEPWDEASPVTDLLFIRFYVYIYIYIRKRWLVFYQRYIVENMGVRITKSICNLLFFSTFGRSCGLVRYYIRYIRVSVHSYVTFM